MEIYKNDLNNNAKKILNKVPEITIFFWIIKILCTTVGETAADYLDVSLNFGLEMTSIIMGILLAIALVYQFKTKKYVPSIYWLNVFLISIFGTLVTDILTDSLGVPLELSTIVFSLLLGITFAIWYSKEKTLSIHSIDTFKREAFYWIAILFTFALGTASGDLMAEGLGLGYSTTGLIILSLIIAITFAWKLGLDKVLAFWIAYILTRPLGASLGDFLSQSTTNGGIGLGPTITSVIFILAIIITVIYLTITKKDQVVKSKLTKEQPKSKNVGIQVTVVIIFLTIFSVFGYILTNNNTQDTISESIVSSTQPLGDLSEFKTITTDTLNLVNEGKLSDAKTRIGDLEYAWDTAQSKLKPMNSDDWHTVDDAIDEVLRNLRAYHQDANNCKESLTSLLDILNSLDK